MIEKCQFVFFINFVLCDFISDLYDATKLNENYI